MQVHYAPNLDGARTGFDRTPCLYSFDTGTHWPLNVLVFAFDSGDWEEVEEKACAVAADLGWNGVVVSEGWDCEACHEGGECDEHTYTESGYTSLYNGIQSFETPEDWAAYRQQHQLTFVVHS